MSRIDRGLSAKEQDHYIEWLAMDDTHRKAIAAYQMDWENFDRLAGIHLKKHARIDPDLLKSDNWNLNRRARLIGKILKFSAFPSAALFILGLHLAFFTSEKPFPNTVEPELELLTRIEQRTLKDGSIIELNRGTDIEVSYTTLERRIKLISGEASFEVEKDPNRPFIVMAGGVDVQAVGTVFNVKLSDSKVDVLVKEGKVNLKVNDKPAIPQDRDADLFLEIGQKATIQLNSESSVVEIINLNENEISEATHWQPRLLDYDSITLGELVEEFNRSNPVQVEFDNPQLESISLSSSFWSDNVEGFVRLMESSFGMEAEWRGSREIVLREKSM